MQNFTENKAHKSKTSKKMFSFVFFFLATKNGLFFYRTVLSSLNAKHRKRFVFQLVLSILSPSVFVKFDLTLNVSLGKFIWVKIKSVIECYIWTQMMWANQTFATILPISILHSNTIDTQTTKYGLNKNKIKFTRFYIEILYY